MQKSVNILVTGTPCVGKTTFSKLLEDKLSEEGLKDFKHIILSQLIVEKKLYKDWNKEFDVPEFDEDMVCDELETIMQKGGVILEFHSSSFFPERWFQLVVLLRKRCADRLKLGVDWLGRSLPRFAVRLVLRCKGFDKSLDIG